MSPRIAPLRAAAPLAPSRRLHPALGTLLTLTALAALALPAHAAGPFRPAPAVPDALAPWVPWVLHGHPSLPCTADGAGRACVWPGRLGVAVGAAGGSFALEVHLDRPGWVRLPGAAKRWPQAVHDNGQPAFVGKDAAGRPRVQLMAGAHKVTGKWAWREAPEVLTVPAELGIALVQRTGKVMARTRRDGERLWLREGAGARDQVTDSLRVQVQRRIDDGVPLKIRTRLLLQVAGRARDVDLGDVLLAGSLPTAVQDGGLPVQVTPEGRVRAHVRPGRHQIEISAELPTDQQALAAPAHASATGLEDTETWVFFPDVQVRTVEVRGATATDPERTRLASDWRGGSTFLVQPGEKLTFRTTRRGEPEAPPNRLRLVRQLWLDVDGEGLTVKDRLSGEMHRDWRADYVGEGTLGRVWDQKEHRDLLITKPAFSGQEPPTKPGDPAPAGLRRTGVELRQGKVDLVAESRLDQAPGAMRAVGWDTDVQSLRATLHLPPGWKLLSADGVDRLPNTWLSSWTLFDFFLVLMVALGTARLVGWPWGVAALAALALAHGERGAPEWVWLSLLGSLALVRALPHGWFRRGAQLWRGLSMLVLVLILVPFSVLQVRHAIYPQVARPGHSGGWTDLNLGGMADKGAMATEALEEAQTNAAPQAAARPSRYKRMAKSLDIGSRKGFSGGSKKQQNQRLSQVDPKAVVQTGPGLPDWRWSSWPLQWSGPVGKGQTLKLVLLSPTANLVLALLRVALMILLGLALLEVPKLRAGVRRWMQGDDGSSGSAGSAGSGAATTTLVLVATLTAGLLAAMTLTPQLAEARSAPSKKAPAPQAQRQQQAQPPAPVSARPQRPEGAGSADIPPTWALDALEDRLVKADACPLSGCVVTPAAQLVVREGQATLRVEVHALRAAAWTLPGGLQVAEVRVDGQPTSQLRRDSNDNLQVRVPAGRHELRITGSLPAGRVVTLLLDERSRPAWLQVDAAGWRVDGLGRDGVPEGSVQLTRTDGAAGPARAEALQTELPPWYAVDRELLLGLPWKVQTTVRRERATRAALVRLPLLPGEAVVTAGVRVEQAKGAAVGSEAREAVVHLPRGVREVHIESELPVTAELALQAPTGRPWTERWTLVCSPIWRCRHTGLTPMARQGSDGGLAPRWQPWPGEQVALRVDRPLGTSGQAMTVDRVDYTLSPGSRLLEGKLRLSIRASQGGARKVTLPAGAELQTVRIDNKERSLRATRTAKGQLVTVPVTPGKQTVELRWQQPWDRAPLERAPAVDIGGPAANVRVKLNVGEDRWLLWAFGPRWGPAVLFWSHLFVLVLLAIGLGRIRGLPLKTWHWLLLSLGFAQLPAPALLPVVAFFAAFAWRRDFWRARPAPQDATVFGLTQIGLVGVAVFFLAALYASIHSNLLMDIDMQVEGMGSSNHQLVWYADRVDGVLPQPGLWSLPLLVWRVAMLLWSLWLVSALIKWLRWGWSCFADGGLWRTRVASPQQAPTIPSAAGPIPAPPPAPEA